MYEYNQANGTLSYPQQIERVVKSVTIDEYFEDGQVTSRTTTVEYEDRQVPRVGTWTQPATGITVNLSGNAGQVSESLEKALKDAKRASGGPVIE